MYIVTSLESQKGNNFGSSIKYINYMVKETNGKLFNNFGEYVNSEYACRMIDNHSKGGIRSGEARWYTPVYAFSEEEALHIASGILMEGTILSRNIKSFFDLTEEEKKLYDSKIIELAMLFQDEMAKNFNKQNLGILSKNEILWFGVVENKRKFTGYDKEVKAGSTKQGQNKLGFNTHIHIIQSRKALNDKKSLISPMANARSKTIQGAGFDRNIFYNKIEQVFDNTFNYKREYTKSFEYFKAQTKTEEYWKQRGKFKTVENKKPNYAKHISKNIDREVITNSRCIDYFFLLEKRGLLEFERKKGNDFYFKKKGQRTGSISVSDKGWYDFSDNSKGGILKAIQIYDKFDWQQSIALIKSLSNDYSNERIQEQKRKLISLKIISNQRLINYINKRGITLNIAVKYLNEVYYDTDEKTNYSIGFKNDSNGFVLRNEKFKSQLGNQDITTFNFQNNKSNKVIIFEGFFNYLSYLQIYSNLNEKAVVMNSSSNYNKLISFIKNEKGINKYYYFGDNDRVGDHLFNKLKQDINKVEDKRYLYEGFKDLNAYIMNKYPLIKKEINDEKNILNPNSENLYRIKLNNIMKGKNLF